MRWAVKQGVDGVVTDDPAKYLDVVGRYEQELIDAVPSGQDWDFSAVPEPTSWLHRGKLHFQAVLIQLLIFVLMPLLKRSARWQFNPSQERRVPKA